MPVGGSGVKDEKLKLIDVYFAPCYGQKVSESLQNNFFLYRVLKLDWEKYGNDH